MSHQQDFAAAMRQSGLTPPPDILMDEWTRFPGIGHEHNRADTAGWCKLFAQGRSGVYGDWRQGLCEKWFDRKALSSMSLSERSALQTQVRTELENVRRLHAQSQARSAERAQQIWDSAPAADDQHPYLQAKFVKSYGLRFDIVDASLIVPIYQPSGELCSLQFIGPDGQKRFMPQGRVRQGHFWLGQPGQIGDFGSGAATPTLLVAEGYSTAASLHEATNLPVCVSFNAGNLLPVCQHVRQAYPTARIVVAGDDDHENEFNVGKAKALEAAKVIGAEVVLPSFSDSRSRTDFNDLHRLDGIDAVRQQNRHSRHLPG